MAKKQVPEGRNKTPKKSSPEVKNKSTKNNSKTQKKSDTGTKNSTATNTKIRNKKEDKIRSNDAPIEETDVLVAPSSSMELEDDVVVEPEEEVVEKRSSGDDDEKETLKSILEKGKKGAAKKRSREEDEDESDAEDNSLYRFPMKRVSRIIKSEIPDIKITQEAVFVINRASEKFLQVFCREAYAYAFLDNKKHTAYEHLSTIVSRRKRLNFLSDIIPEKVKAEDAVAKISEAEK